MANKTKPAKAYIVRLEPWQHRELIAWKKGQKFKISIPEVVRCVITDWIDAEKIKTPKEQNDR